MSHPPITDTDRRLWKQAGGDESQFAALLADTMQAVGATPAPAAEQPAEIQAKLPASTYRQLAGAGAFVALALLALYITLRPGATQPSAPAMPTIAPAGAGQPGASVAPTEAPATVMAYAAPNGAALGPIPADSTITYRYGDSSWGGVDWHGRVVWIQADHAPPDSYPDLAPVWAAPAPAVIEVPIAVPCLPYVVEMDVLQNGAPIGHVTGRSCDSQAAAQANADALAHQMRGER